MQCNGMGYAWVTEGEIVRAEENLQLSCGGHSQRQASGTDHWRFFYVLQADLHQLEEWESNDRLKINPDVFTVIKLSEQKIPVIFPDKPHNVELKSAQTAKYLGV